MMSPCPHDVPMIVGTRNQVAYWVANRCTDTHILNLETILSRGGEGEMEPGGLGLSLFRSSCDRLSPWIRIASP